jgi:hypothetical protein
VLTVTVTWGEVGAIAPASPPFTVQYRVPPIGCQAAMTDNLALLINSIYKVGAGSQSKINFMRKVVSDYKWLTSTVHDAVYIQKQKGKDTVMLRGHCYRLDRIGTK